MTESSKYTFFFMKSDINFNSLVKKIVATPFLNDTNKGFNPLEREPDSLEAVFIERIKRTISIIDPYGNEESQEIADYIRIKFRLINYDNYVLLVLENPPRSKKNFFRFLVKNIDSMLTLDSAQFNVPEILEDIKRSFSATTTIVEKANVSRVLLSPSGSGKIEVKSNMDAIDEIRKLLGGKDFFVDRITCTIKNRESKKKLTLVSSGQIEGDEEVLHLVMPLIRPK